MGIFLLIPYLFYFLLFNFYATWTYYWSWNSTNDADWVQANNIIRWVCLGFWIYFLLFVSLGWLISTGPWRFFVDPFNVLDMLSFPLNLAIIICDIVNADFYKTNAICCPAVLLMWVKCFYYLRIFPQF